MRPNDPLKELIPKLGAAMDAQLELSTSITAHFNQFHRRHMPILMIIGYLEAISGIAIAIFSVFASPEPTNVGTGIVVGVLVVSGAITGWVAAGPGTGDKTPHSTPAWPPSKTGTDDGDGDDENDK